MRGYLTPEDAAQATDSVPPQYMNVVAVERSPRGDHAVVFIAYNDAPYLEPYVVLCQHMPSGWIECGGGSGGGVSWMSTSEDGAFGVQTTWEPRTVHWDVPAPDEPESAAVGSW